MLPVEPEAPNVGALIIRIGFGGPLYYNDKTEPPKLPLKSQLLLELHI